MMVKSVFNQKEVFLGVLIKEAAQGPIFKPKDLFSKLQFHYETSQAKRNNSMQQNRRNPRAKTGKLRPRRPAKIVPILILFEL